MTARSHGLGQIVGRFIIILSLGVRVEEELYFAISSGLIWRQVPKVAQFQLGFGFVDLRCCSCLEFPRILSGHAIACLLCRALTPVSYFSSRPMSKTAVMGLLLEPSGSPLFNRSRSITKLILQMSHQRGGKFYCLQL